MKMSSRIKKAFQSHSRGLTMIEVLLAVAILGVIGIAFMSAMSTATTTLMVGDERTTAESLARRQMEYVKGQGYKVESVLTQPVYQKISDIPDGYAVWSIDRDGEQVEEIIGIPWDSENNRPVDTDKGLQKIALVITHVDDENNDKVIYTFVNDNPNWADGVEITLEGYKVDR